MPRQIKSCYTPNPNPKDWSLNTLENPYYVNEYGEKKYLDENGRVKNQTK